MKTTILLAACGLMCAGTLAAADKEVSTSTTTTTTKTTTGSGTLTEYTPGTTFIVKESSGPVTYKYGNTVTYVTRSGKTISDADLATRIKIGNPVSVEYSSEGDTRIVNKVVIDD